MERHKWRWRSMVEKDAEGFSKIPPAGICILAEAEMAVGLAAALLGSAAWSRHVSVGKVPKSPPAVLCGWSRRFRRPGILENWNPNWSAASPFFPFLVNSTHPTRSGGEEGHQNGDQRPSANLSRNDLNFASSSLVASNNLRKGTLA